MWDLVLWPGLLHWKLRALAPGPPGKFSQVFCYCVHAKLLQSCLTLCDPINCSPPGSSVHGILQARMLEWVALPSSRGFSQPRGPTHSSWSSCIGGRFIITAEPVGKPVPLLTRCYTCFNIYIANPSNHPSTHPNFTFQSKLQTFVYFPQSTLYCIPLTRA